MRNYVFELELILLKPLPHVADALLQSVVVRFFAKVQIQNVLVISLQLNRQQGLDLLDHAGGVPQFSNVADRELVLAELLLKLGPRQLIPV